MSGSRLALCATALEPRIGKLYLARHLVSWRSVTELENYSFPLANLAWNALQATDLPDLARSIRPRPLIVAGASDASGRLPRAEAPYAEYREKPAWDFDALSQL